MAATTLTYMIPRDFSSKFQLSVTISHHMNVRMSNIPRADELKVSHQDDGSHELIIRNNPI